MSDAITDDTMGRDKPRGIKRLLGGMLLAVAGTLALSAWAQNEPPHPGYGGGPRMHHAGLGGPGMFMGRPEQLDRMVDHLLKGLNASDAQRSQIRQIVQATAADLKTQHEAGRGLHEQGLQLLAAPTVDAAAIESLRQQAEARHDQASKRVTQGLVEIAQVLTPEQRTQLAERIKARGEARRDRAARALKDAPPRQ